VLVIANLLRGILILLAATAVAIGVANVVLFLVALVVLGISRFVGSGLSAALPHVVPVRHLVESNSIAVTLGAMFAVLGGGTAILLRALLASVITVLA